MHGSWLVAGIIGSLAAGVGYVFESSPDPPTATVIRWAPGWVLLLVVDWTESSVRERIDGELAARMESGGLHFWDRPRFARRCLAHFLNAPDAQLSRPLVDSIAPLYQAGAFSESERDAIFARCVRISISEQRIRSNAKNQSIRANIEFRLPRAWSQLVGWNKVGSNPSFTIRLGPTEIENHSSDFYSIFNGVLIPDVDLPPGRFSLTSSYSITVENTSGRAPIVLHESSGQLRSTVIAE